MLGLLQCYNSIAFVVKLVLVLYLFANDYGTLISIGDST